MARVKIKLQDTAPARVVYIETDATIGATIGTNLYLNGAVATPASLTSWLGLQSGSTSGGGGSSAGQPHRLLSGLALGDDHPQYTRRDILTGNGDLYSRASNVVTRIGIGTAGDIMRVSGSYPTWSTPQALTRTDDTNVTLTLGGSPTNALVNAASLTLGWTGTLAATRGGTSFGSYAVGDMIYATGASALGKLTIGSAGNILKTTAGIPSWTAPAALTKTDDTNVTLTLGGSAATALINAASLTLGWTGTLAEARGGTAQSTYAKGDLLYASAVNTLSKLAIGATEGMALRVSSTGIPVWGYPGVRVITAAGAVVVTAADRFVGINKTVGAATAVSLPAAPATGLEFVVKDVKGDAAANNITITPAAGNIDGAATYVINTNFGVVRLLYTGALWVTV